MSTDSFSKTMPILYLAIDLEAAIDLIRMSADSILTTSFSIVEYLGTDSDRFSRIGYHIASRYFIARVPLRQASTRFVFEFNDQILVIIFLTINFSTELYLDMSMLRVNFSFNGS